MEIIERTVVLPENQSFLVRELGLKDNKGIIHMHNKYELNFIVDAIGRRFVSGNISRFLPGDLVFMAPGVPHCWEIDNKEINPKAIVLHFNREFFEQYIMNVPEFLFLQQLVKKSNYGLFIKGGDLQLIKKMLAELLNSESSFESILQILKLLKYIAHVNDFQTLENPDFQWDPSLPQNNRLKKIYEYVFFNFRGEIRLNEVSSILGITEGAFCAFFKKCTKKTFSDFIKEVRIGYACKLLAQDTDKLISDVCFDSGYNNFANFNRQFKEITGISPKEYRTRAKD
jgi:YesN/AraC family two-component response regulator